MNVERQVRDLSADKRALLERLLVQRQQADAGIPRRDLSRPAPLSPPQRRLWFMNELARGAITYNAVVALRARGRLDVPAFHAALDAVVARHEVLRTVFGVDASGEPVQVVRPEATVPFEHVILEGGDAALPDATERVREFCRRPYDLAADPPLRVLLVGLDGPTGADHVVAFGEHHIAFDGWSDEILLDELADAYAQHLAGRPWQPPELPVQYADVASWWAQRPASTSGEQYWQQALAGAPAHIDLPTDRPHPLPPRRVGRHLALRVPHTGEALRQLQRQERTTAFMVVTAAFAAALHRWSGAGDVVLGTPMANRGQAELERVIGFFSNTVPLRLRVDGAAEFTALVRQARTACLAAYEHQEVPFERIVELSRAPRDPRRNPLFQVNVRVQQGRPPGLAVEGITTAPLDIDLGFSRFDLAVDLSVIDDDLVGYLEYDVDLFEQATAERFARWFETLTAHALAEPSTAVHALRFAPAQPTIGRRR